MIKNEMSCVSDFTLISNFSVDCLASQNTRILTYNLVINTIQHLELSCNAVHVHILEAWK